MPTNYPDGIDNFENPIPSDPLTDPSHALEHDDINDAVMAIQTELDVNPRGTDASVKARLDRMDAAITEAPTVAANVTFVPETVVSTPQVEILSLNVQDAIVELAAAAAPIVDAVMDGDTASGDLLNTFPSPTVRKLQGFPIAATTPALGHALVWSGTAWTPTPAGGAPSGTAGGDLTDSYPNPTLAATGVVAGPYGDTTSNGTKTLKMTVDAKGRITSISTVTITTPGGASPTGSATGDLGGSYPNPTVGGIQGRVVSNAIPTNNQALVFNGTQYVPQTMVLPSSTPLSGDLSGFLTPGATVVAIQGKPVSSTVLPTANGQALVWNTATNKYEAKAVITATTTAGGDLTGVYPNPTLAAVAGVAGTYGSASLIPQLTVDGKGRITSIGNVALAGGPSVFGVKGDVRGTAGFSITSGSHTLTTASSFFSTDVGKTVIIDAAGAAGVMLRTTVSAYTDSTHVTLTAAAGATVSGAPGFIGTDDTAALNTWVTASGGGLIDMSTLGECFTTTGLTLNVGNTVLRGAGYKTTIHVIAPCDSAIHVTANNCDVHDLGVFSGSSQNYLHNPAAAVIHLDGALTTNVSNIKAYYYNGPFLLANNGFSYISSQGELIGLNGLAGMDLVGPFGGTSASLFTNAFFSNVATFVGRFTDTHDVVATLEGNNFGANAGPALHIRGDSAAMFFPGADVGCQPAAGTVAMQIDPNFTTLTAATGVGAGRTTLTVAPLFANIQSGIKWFLNDFAGHTQVVTTSGSAAIGATSIPVVSFTPNFNYPIGTQAGCIEQQSNPRAIHAPDIIEQAATGVVINGGSLIDFSHSVINLNLGSGAIVNGGEMIDFDGCSFDGNNAGGGTHYDLQVTSAYSTVQVRAPKFSSPAVTGAMDLIAANNVTVTSPTKSLAAAAVPLYTTAYPSNLSLAPRSPGTFGVKGDARAMGGLSITASSTALSAGTSQWNSTDVGKTVIVDGAGAAGVLYRGVITNYTDSTHVTVTPAAGTTASSVTGYTGTDDTVALNNWITACAGSVADMSSLGTCFTTTGITLSADQTVLRGIGYTSRIHVIAPCDSAIHITGFRCGVQWVGLNSGTSQIATHNPAAHGIHVENALNTHIDHVIAFFLNGAYLRSDGANSSFNTNADNFYAQECLRGIDIVGATGVSVSSQFGTGTLMNITNESVILTDCHDIAFSNLFTFSQIGAVASVHIRGDCANIVFNGSGFTCGFQAGSIGMLIEPLNTTVRVATGTSVGTTSIAVQALPSAVLSGVDTFLITDGAGHTQTLTAAANAAIGATTITVAPFTPSVSYPIGSLIGANARLRIPRYITQSGGICGQAERGLVINGAQHTTFDGVSFSLNQDTGVTLTGGDMIAFNKCDFADNNNDNSGTEYDLQVTGTTVRTKVRDCFFDSPNAAACIDLVAGNAVDVTGSIISGAAQAVPLFSATAKPCNITATGAPTTGVWNAGQTVPALDGHIWLCTVAGAPGTWVSIP